MIWGRGSKSKSKSTGQHIEINRLKVTGKAKKVGEESRE
jgi:hypothetical protein